MYVKLNTYNFEIEKEYTCFGRVLTSQMKARD
jgi:hypothetical protein